jgi:hypothetical protein
MITESYFGYKSSLEYKTLDTNRNLLLKKVSSIVDKYTHTILKDITEGKIRPQEKKDIQEICKLFDINDTKIRGILEKFQKGNQKREKFLKRIEPKLKAHIKNRISEELKYIKVDKKTVDSVGSLLLFLKIKYEPSDQELKNNIEAAYKSFTAYSRLKGWDNHKIYDELCA